MPREAVSARGLRLRGPAESSASATGLLLEAAERRRAGGVAGGSACGDWRLVKSRALRSTWRVAIAPADFTAVEVAAPVPTRSVSAVHRRSMVSSPAVRAILDAMISESARTTAATAGTADG